jgi:hypothetical protein
VRRQARILKVFTKKPLGVMHRNMHMFSPGCICVAQAQN